MDIKPLPQLPAPWQKISVGTQKAVWIVGGQEITATVTLDSPRGQCMWDLVGIPHPAPVAVAGTARNFKEARAAAEAAVHRYEQIGSG